MSDRVRSHLEQMVKILETRRARVEDSPCLAQLQKLAEEALEAERANGWQTIETAPKDGTWVLVHRHGWYLPEVAQRSIYAPVWQTLNHGVAPTHWMPLPAPPAALDARPSKEDQR